MNYHTLRRSNVLVMHEDPILSAGLVAALRQQSALEVFVHGVDHLGPDGAAIDVVIADYGTALQLTDAAVRSSLALPPDARILALTSNSREVDIRRAIESGVHGYLLVGGPVSELLDGVSMLAGGSRYMSLSVAQRMADSLTRANLTTRETEVLRLVAVGQPNKTIARQLKIELGTVKSHISAIMAKLGASSRTQAARIAAARGLVEDSAPLDREPRAVRASGMLQVATQHA